MDSWACALTFLPKEYPIAKAASSQIGQLQICSSLKEDEEEMKTIIEQERIIDQEIMEELEKYKMERELGLELEEIGDLRLAEGEESSQDLVENSAAV